MTVYDRIGVFPSQTCILHSSEPLWNSVFSFQLSCSSVVCRSKMSASLVSDCPHPVQLIPHVCDRHTNECWWVLFHPRFAKHQPFLFSYPFCLLQFRRCLLQLLCSRLSWLHRGLKERPLKPVERPIRPIFVSSGGSSCRDRPKKRVTFSSSSIVFIITSDNIQQLDVSSKTSEDQQVNVIQVRPLWRGVDPPHPTTQFALGPNMQIQAKILLSDLSGPFSVYTQEQTCVNTSCRQNTPTVSADDFFLGIDPWSNLIFSIFTVLGICVSCATLDSMQNLP